MLSFIIDGDKCTRCGQCVIDCPARVIDMQAGSLPVIPQEKEAGCYRCQHCLVVCPTAALSILGLKPEGSMPLAGGYPAADQLETLIKGRRSVRRYRRENVDPSLMKELLDVAWHAPTGVNARDVLFTLVDDRKKLERLRDKVMTGLGALVREERLPEQFAFFANFVSLWEEKRVDIIFRDAPHLLIASAPRSAASPLPDCLISLSYFELYAQCRGVGTVWNGLAKWSLEDLLPNGRALLGIPDDHLFGYAMSFGMPAVKYHRTVQHGHAMIHRID